MLEFRRFLFWLRLRLCPGYRRRVAAVVLKLALRRCYLSDYVSATFLDDGVILRLRSGLCPNFGRAMTRISVMLGPYYVMTSTLGLENAWLVSAFGGDCGNAYWWADNEQSQIMRMHYLRHLCFANGVNAFEEEAAWSRLRLAGHRIDS